MDINISEILSIYTETQLDAFIKKYSGFDLNERNLSYSKIEKNWKFLGGNCSNGSNVSMLKNGEKGLVERLTNAIDAVIQKEKDTHNIASANSSSVIIKSAFPKYYQNNCDIIAGKGTKLNVKDALDKVILVVNDGSRSNKPTFDIIDKGTGLSAEEFPTTILSINHGNKLSREKGYLIGAFGQGGSTSLPFTYATIVISKKEGKFSFSVIKGVELNDYKNIVHVYMTDNGVINEAVADGASEAYLNDFINSESGTLIRMVETDISKRFRDNEVIKPGMLGDYINTELFNVGLPVKISDNRGNYKNNSGSQNRYSYGSFLKLQTSNYVHPEYSGKISVEHRGRSYNLDYYILLPEDENLWGRESECKKVMEMFNVYYDPILYTVNGQTITTERFVKLNNAGLSFLKYRLLVVIDLDILGVEKYKFFTADRAQIKDTDLTHGFSDMVVEALANEENLKLINTIIAEKSINSSVDKDLLNDVAKEVKNQYSKYLKNGALLTTNRHGHHNSPDEEEIYENEIKCLEITSTKDSFYKDQNVNFIVETKAQKHINDGALIYAYLDGKSVYDYAKTAMNGRIQYSFNGGVIKPGNHSIKFVYYKTQDEEMSTLDFNFTVLNEKAPESTQAEPTKELDLKINVVDEATLICNVARNKVEKSIEITLCLDTDELTAEVYGKSASSDEIASIKTAIIKPIALFALFYGEKYDDIEDDESKNRLIISFIRSFVVSTKQN